MKKFMLLLILGGMLSTEALAQDLTFGIKAGINLSTLTQEDDFTTRIAPHFGVALDWAVSEEFSVQPELLYSSQGYKQDFNGQDIRGKIDYFNVPVLASYEIIDDLSIQAGPQIGINIRSEVDVEGQGTGNINVNDVDVSAVFGLQLEIDDSFFAQARYGLGLREVPLNSDFKNSVISVSLGFFFDKPDND